ncbi:YcbK family protein [Pseudomonas sp. MBT-1]|uniref:Murein endopeptidase K n=1 Tax=Pseudomonas kielensis TaxID=2762577 RepID=A0A7X1L0P7_9PSED|nr:YcbK family protein [Pseudomonas kielensis]
MNRRQLLLYSLGLLSTGIQPASASTSTFWDQPRRLWLKREVRRGVWEEVNEIYHQNDRLQWAGYVRVCRILRDVHTGTAVQMSHTLLDILCGIQGWFAMHGIHLPIIVTSGYRSEKTNEDAGGVRDSAHLRGGACDLYVQGVPVEYLRQLALYLQGGGVGVYPDAGFIHVDDGKLRTWRGTAKKGRG